jgi:hypothetical protein
VTPFRFHDAQAGETTKILRRKCFIVLKSSAGTPYRFPVVDTTPAPNFSGNCFTIPSDSASDMCRT